MHEPLMYVLFYFHFACKDNILTSKMAEGGFDPCECIWSHEAAMRRLMGLVSVD